MSDAHADRLARLYTGVVHDVLRALGERHFTLPPNLQPILPGRTLAGPAFTIEGKIDTNADPHETLLAWTGLLSQAKPGHVWVAQPNTREIANMGELSAETLKNKGVRGCIIDGLVRDTEFLLKMEFATWCTGFTPRDIVGTWLPKAVEEPIQIGEVVIAPGDYLLADRDGVVRVPKALIGAVIIKAEEAEQAENKVRSAILSGVDPQEAYRRFGKF